MENYQIALLTIVGVLVGQVVALAALTSGFKRFGLAWQTFRRVSADAAFADKVNALVNPPPPEPPKLVKRSAEPLRLLSLLQREGRILDFFLEDISGAPMSWSAPACANCIARRRRSSRNI